jgi:hypothetical protein
MTHASEMEVHEERGAMLAQAGLPPKAAEINMNKATIALARTPARPSHLFMLEGGGVGHLSIYSAYLAIRFDSLAVVPPLGRVLPLVEIFIHLGLNQDA